MNTTLLIMAAGIGSRFGTGIKQLVVFRTGLEKNDTLHADFDLNSPVFCKRSILGQIDICLFQAHNDDSK